MKMENNTLAGTIVKTEIARKTLPYGSIYTITVKIIDTEINCTKCLG